MAFPVQIISLVCWTSGPDHFFGMLLIPDQVICLVSLDFRSRLSLRCVVTSGPDYMFDLLTVIRVQVHIDVVGVLIPPYPTYRISFLTVPPVSLSSQFFPSLPPLHPLPFLHHLRQAHRVCGCLHGVKLRCASGLQWHWHSCGLVLLFGLLCELTNLVQFTVDVLSVLGQCMGEFDCIVTMFLGGVF